MPDVRLRNPNPSDRDALGGSHGRIASAIASLIDSCPGGKSVAIMGGWGSGKSTIVSLLRKALHEANRKAPVTTRVFLFDAWSHQGDPIRRAFLESFFEFLASETEDWLRKDAPFGKSTLEAELRRTTGRSDVVTTKTRKSLSPWGFATAIVTLIVAGLLGALPKYDPSKSDTLRYLHLDLALIAAPFLIVLAARLFRRDASRTLLELLIKDARRGKDRRNLEDARFDFHRFPPPVLRPLLPSRQHEPPPGNRDR